MLAKSGPLTPQSVIDAQQRDGLAGDLAGGLRGIAGVIDAQVIIAPAHEGAFVDDPSHDATASVRLSLAPGAEMNQATLEGVRQFVAAGVSGLDPKRVTILDDRGLTLDDGAQNPDEAQALQASLQSALDLALGAASTIVRVRVTYDPHVRELHEVVRKPVANRAIASITSDEHFKSSSKQYAKSSASLDRGSDVEDERVETPAGRVERLSVAVAVDQARHLDLGKIRALAAGTLGLDPARGDIVSVEELPFARPPSSDRGLPLAMLAGLIASLAPSLAFALAIVAGVRTGAKPIATICERITHRFALQRAARRTAPHFAPAQVRGALENEPPHTAAAIISALPAATATAVLDMYPPEERAAIVRRLARAHADLVPPVDELLRGRA
jgi:flagellar M-ring protein FliF